MKTGDNIPPVVPLSLGQKNNAQRKIRYKDLMGIAFIRQNII